MFRTKSVDRLIAERAAGDACLLLDEPRRTRVADVLRAAPALPDAWRSDAPFFGLTALFTALLPDGVVEETTSIGTLIAFILVCAAMIHGLDWPDRVRIFAWPAFGLVICFAYGRRHSRLQRRSDA